MGLRSRYVNAVLAEADITDEISIFLPPVGGCALALFLDRCSGRFSGADIARLKAVYPLVVGLQDAHIACFDSDNWPVGEGLGATLPGGRPMRILDRVGQEVFQNTAWRNLKARIGAHLDQALQSLMQTRSGQIQIEGGQVLHRAALPAQFSLAPGGAIDMVEMPGRTPLHPDRFDLPPALAAPLTKREADIVRLILQGHPSSSIAAKLGLSRGTVKNHRLRLYEKLDITSEREIFLKYIAAGMNGDA
jgi:DNA-binding CsgD family transcriptional regulator